jgi:hypothetical protein
MFIESLNKAKHLESELNELRAEVSPSTGGREARAQARTQLQPQKNFSTGAGGQNAKRGFQSAARPCAKIRYHIADLPRRKKSA